MMNKIVSILSIALILLFSTNYVSAESGEESQSESEKWLADNAKEEGVITLPSGLQYKVLRKGDGPDYPTVNSPCKCHYKGTLIDGTQFDSSYDRGTPAVFAPNQVIKGWTEAMQKMVEGDKWEMYIPSNLAYGERGSPPKIKGGQALIFTMEIIEIMGGKKPAFNCDPTTLVACTEREKEYIQKAVDSLKGDADAIQEEIDHITKIILTDVGVPESTLQWSAQRVRILQELLKVSVDPNDEDEF